MESDSESSVTVEGLTKHYDELVAVDDISLTVEAGELATLLGPSGCGKTTTLRSIAGLERPTAGRIAIGDETVSDTQTGVFVPPAERDIGFVFQTFDVWPHMSVYENVAFPLKCQDYPDDRIGEKVAEILEMANIGDLSDKPARDLSGGQQARVNICRSVVYEPQLLLFDEPLTGLDRNLRKQLRYEIKRIQTELGITTIYVTHDQPEAMSLSDRIFLFNLDGKIEQRGSPEEVYSNPETRFSFDFFGGSEIFPGTVTTSGGIDSAIGALTVDHDGFAVGERVLCGVRPRHVTVSANGATGENVVSGTLRSVSFLGETYELLVDVDGTQILSRAEDVPDGVAEGEAVRVQIQSDHVHVFPEGR